MALESSGHRRPQKGAEKGPGSQESVFLRAFDEHADALFRHAQLRLSDRERAIELVHDAFTKAWGYLREGNEISSYRAFLYKVLHNLIIDEYRRRRETSLDAILEADGVDEGMFVELRAGSLDEVVNALDARQALALVGELPDIYRESVILRFVDGLSPKEIGALIEESENVVSVRIHRGIKILREKIDARQKGGI